MNVRAYLDRIGHTGPVTPSLATLNALHRAHLLRLPYENLDIHLGRRLSLDPRAIFQKIVLDGRGGWCFEMNGLFAWALSALGFGVRLISSGVLKGDGQVSPDGDHAALIVTLDRPYLADVGWGNGFLEPLPLEAGTVQRGLLTYQLAQQGDRWTFLNHSGDGYTFGLTARDLTFFEARNACLQSSPDSGFRQRTVCHILTESGPVTLRGATLTARTAQGVQERVVTSAAEYCSVLHEQFHLDLPQAARLWSTVWDGHLKWVASSLSAI